MASLNEANVGKMLEWAYEKAVNGIPGTDTAYELAESYLSENSNIDAAINSLVNWQISKCATSGFIAGLGGVIGGSFDAISTKTIAFAARETFKEAGYTQGKIIIDM